MVRITLESKRYCCTLDLKEKVTFIQGSSGVGKSEFTRRVSSGSKANIVSVSNGFDLVVLTSEIFRNICNKARRSDNGLEERKVLKKILGG